MKDAAELGELGAEQARQQADATETPDDVRQALGFWNEMIGVAKTKTGELIHQSRNAEPPVPWTEIGSALGISPDAARQRWLYYKDEAQ